MGSHCIAHIFWNCGKTWAHLQTHKSRRTTRFFGSLSSNRGWKDALERKYPRLEVEIALGDAIVAQALKTPSKAPAACWPGCLLRAHLADPDYKGVNKEF